MKILVVDDHPLILSALIQLLPPLGQALVASAASFNGSTSSIRSATELITREGR